MHHADESKCTETDALTEERREHRRQVDEQREQREFLILSAGKVKGAPKCLCYSYCSYLVNELSTLKT